MKAPARVAKLLHDARLAIQLVRLPVVRLRFEQQRSPEGIRKAHAHFTRRHSRYKVIGNKTMGVAVIDLRAFGGCPDGYLHGVQRSSHAGPRSRKAAARGYQLRQIDRNEHIDEIYAIHTSCEARQGRPMDPAYRVRKTVFDDPPPFECHGVFDAQGRLVAYCKMARYGNFVAIDQLMGYKNQDGVMYFLLLKIICRLIEEREVDFFMYDSYFGAKQGMRDFKRRIGFQPYWARYELV